MIDDIQQDIPVNIVAAGRAEAVFEVGHTCFYDTHNRQGVLNLQQFALIQSTLLHSAFAAGCALLCHTSAPPPACRSPSSPVVPNCFRPTPCFRQPPHLATTCMPAAKLSGPSASAAPTLPPALAAGAAGAPAAVAVLGGAIPRNASLMSPCASAPAANILMPRVRHNSSMGAAATSSKLYVTVTHASGTPARSCAKKEQQQQQGQIFGSCHIKRSCLIAAKAALCFA
jgi:hypothetical protein